MPPQSPDLIQCFVPNGLVSAFASAIAGAIGGLTSLVGRQVFTIATSEMRRKRAVESVEFGIAADEPVGTTEFIHATLQLKSPWWAWWAETSINPRLWIQLNNGGFFPAHLDGLAIKGGQDSFEETRFLLEHGDEPVSVPLVSYRRGGLAYVYDRRFHRGEGALMPKGENMITLKLKFLGAERHQVFVIRLPDSSSHERPIATLSAG